jgi:hypothetical protein
VDQADQCDSQGKSFLVRAARLAYHRAATRTPLEAGKPKGLTRR